MVLMLFFAPHFLYYFMEEFLNSVEQKGFYVFDSFLSNDEAASVLAELKQHQSEAAFKKAGIGKQERHRQARKFPDR